MNGHLVMVQSDEYGQLGIASVQPPIEFAVLFQYECLNGSIIVHPKATKQNDGDDVDRKIDDRNMAEQHLSVTSSPASRATGCPCVAAILTIRRTSWRDLRDIGLSGGVSRSWLQHGLGVPLDADKAGGF